MSRQIVLSWKQRQSLVAAVAGLAVVVGLVAGIGPVIVALLTPPKPIDVELVVTGDNRSEGGPEGDATEVDGGWARFGRSVGPDQQDDGTDPGPGAVEPPASGAPHRSRSRPGSLNAPPAGPGTSDGGPDPSAPTVDASSSTTAHHPDGPPSTSGHTVSTPPETTVPPSPTTGSTGPGVSPTSSTAPTTTPSTGASSTSSRPSSSTSTRPPATATAPPSSPTTTEAPAPTTTEAGPDPIS